VQDIETEALQCRPPEEVLIGSTCRTVLSQADSRHTSSDQRGNGGVARPGLSVKPVGERLNLPVTSTAACWRACATGFALYRLPGGRLAFANTTAPRG
jgi:hypothetical protein